MQTLIDDTTVIKAVDLSPAEDSHYRARFYFDPNSIAMGNNTAHYILDGYNAYGNWMIFRLELLYENGQYKLRPRVMNDDWTGVIGSKYPISDDWHVVEIEWKRASAPSANDGFFSLWIDETLVETISNVDNDERRNTLDEVRLGATGGIDSTTSGSMYFDGFVSRRESYIGSGVAPTATPASTATQEPSPTSTETPTLEPARTETPTLEPTPTETPTPSPTPLANVPGGVYSNVSFNLPAFLQIRSDYAPNLQANNVTTTITYTYDALHRITGASYSDGRSFSYTYDANGNALTYSNQSAVTSYQYDAANQLQTAELGESLWYYVYDANGSLVEVLPNNIETSGAKRYTYNTAGYLTQVEAHNGAGWDVQAEMSYNGLGQRLGMDASGVIAYYVMDGNRPLTATTGTDTTSYLYGLGAIGEETDAWSYGLTDGTNTQRQLTDATGEVTYSARYTPWGDTLEASGTGNLTIGYFGGLMDAATGLLYVGDGQYYDPSTGRFLTRNARPNSANPYLPFDPTGALFLPLALVSLLYGRKRRKSKWDILVIVALLGLSAGLGVAACGSDPSLPLPPGTTVKATIVEPVGSNQAQVTLEINETTLPPFTLTGTPIPPSEIVIALCPEAPTGTPTPVVDLASLEPSQVTGANFLPYIKALANKYGFFLPDGFEWATYFYNHVEATPTPIADGQELTYHYGTVCSSVLGCPAIDGGTFHYGLVYITNLAFDDLSQVKLASIMLHEGRHAWYEYKFNNGNSLGVPGKNDQAYKVLTEVDAHSVMLQWLSAQGISKSDGFYQKMSSWRDVYKQAKSALGLNYPDVLPFCEPMRSWCG
ncbi:MAG TPA: hypothetical protein PLV64_13040 [Anaerolineales bacterium]|nr:hypothetical protein [Anaerolineales bacterium]